MTHVTRIERHIGVDVLAGALGASAVEAVVQLSWKAGLLALALGVALFFFEKSSIEEEEAK